ncbi:MAG TPA: restriction endonuclease subunit S [Ktedonobacteraceae bacterium]
MNEQLPAGWVWTTLNDICVIIMGQSPPSSAYNEKGEGLPFFQGKAEFTDLYPVIKKWCIFPTKIAEANDILLSVRAPVGPTNLAPTRCSIGRGLAALRPVKPVEVRYVLYAIRNFASLLVELATGTTFEAISGDDIRTFGLPLPPANEQTRIVAAIEQQFARIDAAVTSLESARGKTKQYRASLLKAAVEGELTRAWREQQPEDEIETGEELLERILVERRARWEAEQLARMKEPPKNDRWKEAYQEPQEPDVENLPALPDEWCWATVEQVIIYMRNGLPQKPEAEPPGYRIFRINAVRPMKVDLDEIRYLSLPASEVQGYFVENGDLLFTRYNGSLDLLGVAGMVKGRSEPTLHPDKLIRVKTVIDETLPSFLEIACNVGVSRAFIESRARTTAGQKGIAGSDIKQMPIPLPPLAEQAQIVAEVEAKLSELAKMEEAIEHSLKRAGYERQSILREAFAGRLVEQEPGDEPAGVLLERIREERQRREVLENERRKEARKMANLRKSAVYKTSAAKLYHTLAEAPEALRPEELFRQAGLRIEVVGESQQLEPVITFFQDMDHLESAGAVVEERPDESTVLVRALDVPESLADELLPADEDAAAGPQEQEETGLAAAGEIEKVEAPRRVQTSLWDLDEDDE